MNLNIKAKKQNTFDAIVVGSGISGGWAAKELTEKGLKTLVLERGRDVKHVVDYPTATKNPWDLPNGDRPNAEDKKNFHKQLRTGYTVKPSTRHWWVNDLENPYSEEKRFDWMRGYHVGGRSITWGRQSYRLSEMDFEANAKDGFGVDWPVRYKDIAPWYDYVESHIGVNGKPEGLAQLPDGKFLPPHQFNCLEEDVSNKIARHFSDRIMTIGRSANLTQNHNGRAQCQYRNLCIRGCPYGAYFSSQSSTLPAAEATGNLTLRPNSIVHTIIFDPDQGKATGVEVLDAETGETITFNARVIFLCASAIASAQIMLNSTSDRFPNGFGNDSGELGCNVMDHHLGVGAQGLSDDFSDNYYYGRRPNGIYIPRFRNIKEKHPDFIRGYGYQGSASRQSWSAAIRELGFGAEFKEEIAEPGPWRMGIGGFGECLPYHENKMTLNKEKLDKYGLPTVTFDVEFKENEMTMRKDMAEQAAEMLEAAGLKNVKTYDRGAHPGLGIHEMGTARMGRSAKSSVLNKWNQVHAAKNVFVTDGAFMTSAACQNPSLTYMAFTARAADYAVKEINRRNL